MDKNKSEKLKEILNQTISQKEIEEKLKKEIELTAIKKAEQKKIEEELKKKEDLKAVAEEEQIKEEKSVQKEALQEKTKKTKIESSDIPTKEDFYQETIKKETKKDKKEIKKEEAPENKKVVIPNVRDKKKANRDINIILYLVGAIALLLLLVVIYLFMNKEDLSSSNISTNKKEITTEKFYDEKVIKQDQDIKKILEEEIKKDIKTIEKDVQIKEPLIKIQENIQKEVKKEEKPKEIIKEIIKEKIVTKVVKLDKKNFKTYYNSSKFTSLKCYNFKAGDVFPTNTCKKNLSKFLEKNKKAIRFEVIPVIAENDNIIFDKLQSNMKNMDKAFQDRVKEYMYRGLSRERVLETTWYIKDILGEDTILTPTNYYVKSKKNNKGIIIKAYH